MVIKGGGDSTNYTLVKPKKRTQDEIERENIKKQRKVKTFPIKEIAEGLVSEDPKVRIEHLSQLRTLINRNTLFTELEFLQIWKGLFLYVWGADKPLWQDKLNEKISDLISIFHKTDMSLQFIRSFFVTMFQKWHLIDRYRLDKYYSLVRKMLRKSFKLLLKHQDAPGGAGVILLQDFIEVLKETCLNPALTTTAETNGLVLHIADIYLVELYSVSQGYVDASYLNKLLMPFINYIAKSDDEVAMFRMRDRVFHRIMTTFSPFEERDPWMVEEEYDEEGEVIQTIFPTDYKMLSKLFLAIASSKKTKAENRKLLFNLSNRFEATAKKLQDLEESADNLIDENFVDEDGNIIDQPEDGQEGEDEDEDEDVELDGEEDEDVELDGEEDELDEEDLEDELDGEEDELDEEDFDEEEEEEEEEELPPTPPKKNNKNKQVVQTAKVQTPPKKNQPNKKRK